MALNRSSLQDVRSVGDPLQQWNWDLIIPSMPGNSSSRAFTFKCMTAVIPGVNLEEVAVALHGVELKFAGRKNYTHTFDVQLLETSDLGSRAMFVNWSELARSWVANTGAPKSIYSTTIQLVLYDDTPSEVRTVQIFGAWPQTVSDATLDGQASGAVTITITFSYDYTVDSQGGL